MPAAVQRGTGPGGLRAMHFQQSPPQLLQVAVRNPLRREEQQEEVAWQHQVHRRAL